MTVKVEEIMAREARGCAPNDMLNRAAQIMWENNFGCVPVIAGESKVVGMLTDRDICMAAYTQGATLNSIQVSSAMSREVFSCRPSDDLVAAQQVMRDHQVRRLPVTDADGKLVGIVSLSDIARAMARTTDDKAQVASTLAAICAPPDQRGAEPQSTGVQGHHRERSRGGGRRRGTRRNEPSTEGTPR
jgi:CBS domain-containing protein